MVASALIGIFLAVGVIAYWKVCAKNSLESQCRAAILASKVYQNVDIPDHDKRVVHSSYRSAQKWWYIPVTALVTPLIMLAFLRTHDQMINQEIQKQQEYKDAMEAIMFIYATRNPITSVACMVFMMACFIPAVLIGLVLNRIDSIPSPAALISGALSKRAHDDGHHRAY